ncbi:hypothetical protein AB1Y20_014370 [Prymnesium parvum]|uniref:Tubulin--tyrosine ligase-like protein 9 n=1 Tax=Prymnesium parvum TaxID=97485 RepID=A0AB34IGG0_PRYPA
MDLLEIYDADTPTLHRMLAEIDAFLSSAAPHPAPAIADATRRRDVVRLELEERRASDAIYHQMALPAAAPAAPAAPPPAFASPSPRLASPSPPLPSSPSPSAPAAAPAASAPLPSLAERLRAAQREEAEAKARERAARAARAAAAGRQAAEAKAAAAEKAAEAQRLAAERLTQEEEGNANSGEEPEVEEREEVRQEEHRGDAEGGVESGEAAGLREEEGAADIPAASDATERAVAMAEGRAEAACSGRRASSWRSGAAAEDEERKGEARESAREENKAEEERVEEEKAEEQLAEQKLVQEERAVRERDDQQKEESEEERQGGAEAQSLPAATEAESLRLDRRAPLHPPRRTLEPMLTRRRVTAEAVFKRKPEGGKGEGGRSREAARKGKGAGRGVVRAVPPLMDFGSLDEEEDEEDEDEDEDEAEAGGIAEWRGSAEPLDVVQAVQRLQLAFPDASEELLRAAISQASPPHPHHRSFPMAMSFLFQQHLFPPASRAVAYGRRQVKPPPAAAIAAVSDGGNRPAYSKFEDIFLTPPPSVELLRKHLECVELFYAELRAPQPEWEYRFFRVAQAKTEIYQILRDLALASRDAAGGGVRWLELPPSLYGRSCATWNLLWTWRPPRVQFAELLPWQRVNHFPNARNLTRKDMLKKHLQRARQLRGDAFDIMPLTYALPAEYLLFVDAYSRCADESDGSAGSNRWIMKPVGLSRGRGISIIDDISAVSYGEAYVIQRYVHRPLLLDGFKFDLRLYVCVNSFTPLEAYIYKEGFGRFSTERYSNDPASLSNKFVHLTNSSIQKEQTSLELLAKSSNFDNAVGGTKCALSLLLQRLRAAGIDTAALWGRIVEVVLRSLFAVQDAIPSYPSCFELFGYDLLIDTEMKPWLLEVNASPSLARENPLDSKVKDALLADTLRLVAPPHFDRAIWAEMVRSRLPDRPADRSRLSSAPPFTAELAALLHGQTAFFSGRPPPSEDHARACSYERIAPSAAWERVVGRRGERGVARAQSGGGGGPPLHVRGSLDRFL